MTARRPSDRLAIIESRSAVERVVRMARPFGAVAAHGSPYTGADFRSTKEPHADRVDGRLAQRAAAALAAAAAAILTAQAPASAEPPVPADRPTFTGFLPNHTIAVGSAVKVATVWLSSNLVVDPVLTLDAGGLAPVATVEFPDFCTVNGSDATCPIDEDVRSVPLRLTPVPGVAPGTRGTISYQASAGNIEP